MRPPLKSSRTMLLSRSLMSSSGNVRSTRASSVTSPEREKYPTPELNSTTRVIGSVTAGFTSCFASAGAAASSSLSAPMPAPTPSAPATGATKSHLPVAIECPPREFPRAGCEPFGRAPAAGPIIPDPVCGQPPGHRGRYEPRGAFGGGSHDTSADPCEVVYPEKSAHHHDF